MKKRFSAIILSLVFLLLLSSYRHITEPLIKITITNLRNNKGHILISLFKDGAGYPDKPEKAFRRGKVAVSNNTAIIDFTGIPSGNYAIAIMHDENDDQKMNTNFFGIPKEGYGFSNNVMGVFGPPSYSKASFNYSSTTAAGIFIKTRY